MNKLLAVFFLILLAIVQKNFGQAPAVAAGQNNGYFITINKAAYKPGETVTFNMNKMQAGMHARYWHLGKIIGNETLTSTTWRWQPPTADYKGYFVEIYRRQKGKDIILTSIAVDVSSEWSRFPRYGFLSEFGKLTDAKMNDVILFLNRNHINGLQFYDWQDKHHQPLAGTVAHPAEQWKDIADRECYKKTVQSYIRKAHEKGMNAMFYNLCYGALSDAAADGVKDQWYMYKDSVHVKPDAFVLPKPPFKSDILFTDPSNPGWQQYLAAKNSDVYDVYDFDGYHVDQVGERESVQTYNGNKINLGATFNSFLVSMKQAHPKKKIVMNAVNQYGQEGSIAAAPVDFLYSELWTGNEGYRELALAIQNNHLWSNGKSTVLAAYLNYTRAENPGTFNTAGVLLANAVIFSFGGSHLELGEHMLGKEYFPNNNLQMNAALKKSIVHYYDFLTGFENLLRDGGTFNSPVVTCSNNNMNLAAWPPQDGKLSFQGKIIGSKQVLHLINFANAINFEWRDTNGTQTIPNTLYSLNMEVSYAGTAKKVWVASPDINFGIPRVLSFIQSGNTVKFTLPQLQYWDMIVIE